MYRNLLYKCPIGNISYLEEVKNEEIDFVYTWVDSTDLLWKRKKETAQKSFKGQIEKIRFPNDFKPDMELELSLLFTLKNVIWLRNIFIVTMRPQIPACLFKSNYLKGLFYSGKIKIIHHDQLGIPVTFNSSVIECYIHKIPSLSNNFIYLNDDFYILKPVTYSYFFQAKKPIIITNNQYIESFLPKYILPMYSKSVQKTLSLQKNLKHYCTKHHAIPYTLNKHFCEQIFVKYKKEIIINNTNVFRSENDFLFYIMVLNEGLKDNLFLIFENIPFHYKFFNNKRLSTNISKYTFICMNNMNESIINEEIQRLKLLY